MQLDSASRFHELKGQIWLAMNGGLESVVYERGAHAHPVRIHEHIVQAIWNEQLLYADKLVTCSGKPVRVIDAGQWNSEGGPDFRMADLQIGTQRIRGDVEIHVDASDWEKHGHERDFDYNNVVLHVFLYNDDQYKTDLLHNGSRLERLALEPFLNPDLDTITRSLSTDDYLFAQRDLIGRCHVALSQLAPGFVEDFFREASRERIESKVERVAAQCASETLDQVLYQSIMASMGYKGGKTLFFLLAKRTPIEELKSYLRSVELRDLHVALESILLNVANLVPAASKLEERDLLSDEGAGQVCEGAAFDAETQDYINSLNAFWTRYSGYFSDRVIPPTKRWFASVRPVNFPTRRIAGIARLLTNFDFRGGLAAGFVMRLEQAMQRMPKTSRDFKREIQQLSLLFAASGNSYWSRHYTFGGKPSPKQLQLIGDDRAASVLFNALLPVGLYWARQNDRPDLEDFIWRLIAHFPSLPENTITKFMKHRLFGAAGGSFINWRLEKNSQALFHIFHDCCNNNALTCDECTLARLAEKKK